MKQFFSPLSEFFLYAYIGNKRNTPKMDKIVSPLRSVIAGFNCIYTLSHEFGSEQSANERRSEHSGARERSEQCRANLASEWIVWASERCDRMSERRSERRSTNISISRGSESPCTCQSCHVWNTIISSKMDWTLNVYHFAIAKWRFSSRTPII